MLSIHAYNPVSLVGLVVGVAIVPVTLLATLFALVRISLGF